MSYAIHFSDKTSTIVSTEKGEYLKEKLLSTKQAINIEINGELYRSTQIVSIKRAVDPDARPDFERATLPAGPQCHGERSIQNEINQIIKDQYSSDWAKRIGRPKVREAIRQKLRERDTNWCDFKAGTCVCGTKQLTMPAQA